MTARTGTGERYGAEVGVLWTGLARTLGRLEVLAAEPDRLDEPTAEDALRRLQYALHLAVEHAYGLEPPDGQAPAHAELSDALVRARDATSEVAEAVSLFGAEGIKPLVHEWRGTLFRVRLARLRVSPAAARREPTEEPAAEPFVRPLIAFLLALVGAVAFVGGATVGYWPIWVAGVLAVAGGMLSYRP